MKDAPRPLLNSSYRKKMWRNAKAILEDIEKVIPISEAHLMGSFTTKKRRPADVDFILLLKTPKGSGHWSIDLVIAPDNGEGEHVLEDAKKWMKQKYGAKKSGFFRLK
ncbi:MAG: hypothetical protein G01um101425_651 [Candidatus Peregrinibacteria bacterium Gr01-1014_25]|nr:MAG: hypothetical protein G01um101425_651 [Candidatus Peregrinibacteria bacterium Gr01-1014_25]